MKIICRGLYTKEHSPETFLRFIKGFTLIEVMIVIAIIAIGLSIVIPNFIAYKERQQVPVEQTEEFELDSNQPWDIDK